MVRRHAEDLAVLRVHNDDAGIVSAHLRLKGRDVTLNDALYPDVDGGDHRVAVRRRLDDALQIRLVVQIAVLSACRSHQLAVVVLLDAAGSLGSLTLGEADDIAAQGPLGIGTDVGVFEPCAVDPLLHRLLPESVVHLLHPAFKLRLLVVGQVFRVADIAGIAAVRDDLPKVVLAVAEDLAEQRDRGLQVLILILVDDVGIQDQRVDLVSGGEEGAVPVHDIAAAVGNDPGIVLLLRQNALVVLLSEVVLNVPDAEYQRKQSQHDHQSGDCQLFSHICPQSGSCSVRVPGIICGPSLSAPVRGCLHTVSHTHFPCFYSG